MTTPIALALFAADWVEVVVPAVVFVIWLINQIAAVKKGGPAGRPPARPNAPNAPGQGAAPQAGGQRGLMDEVERFLREARKAMEQPQGGAQQAKQVPPQQRQPKQKQPRQKKASPAAQKPLGRLPQTDQPRLQSRLSERSLDDVRAGGSVARHVQEHLDTSRFDERAGKLSHLKQTVEQDIGTHVHDAFEHKVGTLAAQDSGKPPAPIGDEASNPALQIAAMLRDPASMRNAIILQEILSPPTHRW
jgi:hypothetical protein